MIGAVEAIDRTAKTLTLRSGARFTFEDDEDIDGVPLDEMARVHFARTEAGNVLLSIEHYYEE